MNKVTFCTKIFDPYYIYRHCARQTGEHLELKSMLDYIGLDDLISLSPDSGERVFPVKAFFHHYKPNIAVISISDDSFHCQTFKNGLVDVDFDLLNEPLEAKQFFEETEGELTVIDYFSGKEIEPSYDNVLNYVNKVLHVETELSKHNNLIAGYKERLQAIKKDFEVFYACSPSTYYKSAINIIENCLETAEETFCSTFYEMQKEIRELLSYKPEEESYIKTFGLYVYVIDYGLLHRRFLAKGTKRAAINFNQILSRFRKFIDENEGIVDKYMDYMNMNRNERENLSFLLSQEQLISNGKKYIGDDLFC